MKILGEIVAILNDSQVLARGHAPGAWDRHEQGQELLVLEVKQLPAPLNSQVEGGAVYLPKGTIAFLARQPDAQLAILSTETSIRKRIAMVSSPLSSFLGAAAGGVSGILAPRETVEPSSGRPTASLDDTESLKLSIGPAHVGDVIGYD